jgi:error-prone DNA polymerase
MGFYSPATIVKDAQRHGLRVKPIDVLCSDWFCTIESAVNKNGEEAPCLRIGLRYVRGLRQKAAEAIVRAKIERPFFAITELAQRVPELQKSELVTLSEIGALNSLGKAVHRRTALWQVERAARPAGPLLDSLPEESDTSPLERMTDEERLVADYHGSGMTAGPHPMAYCRNTLASMNIKRACDLERVADGEYARVAGSVVARQRPGTAKGFVFLSLEDETGIANVIINPDLYARCRLLVNREKFLRVEGVLQNQDGVVSIKASQVLPVAISAAETESHDYH